MCVCVCLICMWYMCVYAHVCESVIIQVRAEDQYWVSFSITLCLSFWDRFSHRTWGLTFWPDFLDRKSLATVFLHPLHWNYWSTLPCLAQHGCWDSNSVPRVQALYLWSHRPSLRVLSLTLPSPCQSLLFPRWLCLVFYIVCTDVPLH